MSGYALDPPTPKDEIPDEFAHLLTWYGDIRARAARGFLFEPIQISEVEAYARRLQRVDVEMEALDEELLYRIDAVWMEVNRPPEKA